MSNTVELQPASLDVETEADETGHLRYLWLFLVVAATGLWLLPATASLWLDETGTFWVVKDGLHNTIDRAIRFQGQSPLYYLVVFITTKVAGTSELALRAPSLIACGLVAFFLYKLGCELFDKSRALISAIILAVGAPLVTVASDARPYALGLMFLVAATWYLVRWVQHGGVLNCVIYVLLASMTIYAHYLFALGLAAHPVYYMLSARAGNRTAKSYLIAAGGILLCVSPTLTQVSSLFGRRSSLTIVALLSFDNFASVFTPAALVFGLLLGWLISRSTVHVRVSLSKLENPVLYLLVIWLVLPPLVLYAISIFTPITLFQGRYYLASIPAFALFMGWLIGSARPQRAQRLIVLSVAICSILTVPVALSNQTEDWRRAAEIVNHNGDARSLVLVDSDFVEAGQPGWLNDPEKRSYLLAPFSYYKIGGEVHVLPGKITNSVQGYLSNIETRIHATDHFFVIARLTFERWRSWAFGESAPLGFQEVFSARYGQLYVEEFRRPAR